MQITIFGASGKVGRRVVELALMRNYTVVAFVHSHDPFVGLPNLIVKKGDIYTEQDVAEAIKGSNAVISCLGSWHTKHKNVLVSAMRSIIPAMQEQKITRIMTLTGSGAIEPGKEPSIGYQVMMKLLKPFPAGKVFTDGENHMHLLAESNLDWTTIRSPIMTNFGSSDYQLNLKLDNPLTTINREAVAISILDELEAKKYLHQAPIIHRK